MRLKNFIFNTKMNVDTFVVINLLALQDKMKCSKQLKCIFEDEIFTSRVVLRS